MAQLYASSFLFKLYSVIFLLLISYGLRNANANEDSDGEVEFRRTNPSDDDESIGDLLVGGSRVGSYRRGGNYDNNENVDEDGNEHPGDDEVSSSSSSDDDGTSFTHDNVIGWRVVQQYGRRYVVPVNGDEESAIANFWWTEIYRNGIPYMFPSDFEDYANTDVDFGHEDDDSDEVSSNDSMEPRILDFQQK